MKCQMPVDGQKKVGGDVEVYSLPWPRDHIETLSGPDMKLLALDGREIIVTVGIPDWPEIV